MAKGFMAGFGQAFSKSFENAANRRHDREQDAFRMQYSDYLDRRKTKETWDREDAKISRQARSLAGTVGLPYEAVDEMLRGGWDTEDIVKYAQEGGTAEVTQNNQPSVNPASEQTQNMMAQNQAPVQTGPMETEKKPGILQRLFKGRDASSVARNRIAQMEGISPEEVQSTLESTPGLQSTGDKYSIKFNPPKEKPKLPENISITDAYNGLELARQSGNESDIKMWEGLVRSTTEANDMIAISKARSEAKAQGTLFESPYLIVSDGQGGKKMVRGYIDEDGITRDEQGNILDNARAMNKSEADSIDQIFEKSAKSIEKFNADRINAADQIRLTKEAEAIVDGDERVLNVGGSLAQSADKFLKNIGGVVDVLKTELISNRTLDPSQRAKLAETETELKNILSRDTQNLAVRKALFDTIMMRLAISRASSQGQEGRNLSDKDLAMFKDEARSGNNPEAFRQNNALWIKSTMENLKNQRDSLNQFSSEVQRHFARFGFYPPDIVGAEDEFIEGGYQEPDINIGDVPEDNNPQGTSSRTEMPQGLSPEEEESWFNALPDGSTFTVIENGKRVTYTK